MICLYPVQTKWIQSGAHAHWSLESGNERSLPQRGVLCHASDRKPLIPGDTKEVRERCIPGVTRKQSRTRKNKRRVKVSDVIWNNYSKGLNLLERITSAALKKIQGSQKRQRNHACQAAGSAPLNWDEVSRTEAADLG